MRRTIANLSAAAAITVADHLVWQSVNGRHTFTAGESARLAAIAADKGYTQPVWFTRGHARKELAMAPTGSGSATTVIRGFKHRVYNVAELLPTADVDNNSLHYVSGRMPKGVTFQSFHAAAEEHKFASKIWHVASRLPDAAIAAAMDSGKTPVTVDGVVFFNGDQVDVMTRHVSRKGAPLEVYAQAQFQQAAERHGYASTTWHQAGDVDGGTATVIAKPEQTPLQVFKRAWYNGDQTVAKTV